MSSEAAVAVQLRHQMLCQSCNTPTNAMSEAQRVAQAPSGSLFATHLPSSRQCRESDTRRGTTSVRIGMGGLEWEGEASDE